MDPGETERHVPDCPDHSSQYDGKPGADALGKSRQQPSPPADLFEQREERNNHKPDDGVEGYACREGRRPSARPSLAIQASERGHLTEG